MPKRQEIPVDKLRALLVYSAETGELVWKYREGVRSTWNTRYAGKPAGSARADGYYGLTIDACRYDAHRVIYAMMTGAWPVETIDHVNGDPSDNRWVNLRAATYRQNQGNRRRPQKNNVLGVKGVVFHGGSEKNPYMASVRVNRKSRYLGLFPTIEAAAEAYRMAAIEVFGEFSHAGN